MVIIQKNKGKHEVIYNQAYPILRGFRIIEAFGILDIAIFMSEFCFFSISFRKSLLEINFYSNKCSFPDVAPIKG